MNDSTVYRCHGYTLVDITNTGVTKYNKGQEKYRNQHRNYETLIQLLSLRTQIFSLTQKSFESDVSDYEFGAHYTGHHMIWSFTFDVEYKDVYNKDGCPFGILLEDFSQVPVIVGLTETASFPLPIFYTKSEFKNVHFNLS